MGKHNKPTGLPWESPCVTDGAYGVPMDRLPWAIDGAAMGLPWVSSAGPWSPHGTLMGLPWVSPGFPVDL